MYMYVSEPSQSINVTCHISHRTHPSDIWSVKTFEQWRTKCENGYVLVPPPTIQPSTAFIKTTTIIMSFTHLLSSDQHYLAYLMIRIPEIVTTNCLICFVVYHFRNNSMSWECLETYRTYHIWYNDSHAKFYRNFPQLSTINGVRKLSVPHIINRVRKT